MVRVSITQREIMRLAMGVLRDENIAPCGGADKEEFDRPDARALADGCEG